ncbi:MAG: methyltransferase domain-containing protein [Phycisphaeraceae bacterium]|nr:methyltransferase domain-containing protein [Phycisphaeraceae bacterium]
MNEKSSAPFWEGLYANRDAVDTFGPPNPEILELVPTLPPGAKVLDLGCGEGRLALPLAEAGFQVVGVDVSEAGIAKLTRIARDRGLEIEASVEDLNAYEIPGEFDLMISDGVFHNIHREHAERLIASMIARTRPGGYNLVKLFTTKVPPPPELAKFHIGLWEEEELFDRYEGWEFLIRSSFILEDEHPDGSRHRHPINKILARKPA